MDKRAPACMEPLNNLPSVYITAELRRVAVAESTATLAGRVRSHGEGFIDDLEIRARFISGNDYVGV